jgi:hypothetical protein
MALPTGDMEWPPPAVATEIKRVNRLAAWYGGDLDTLYPSQVPLSSRRGDGWLQRFGRRGDGSVSPSYGESSPVHVPVAADLARTSASLLFSRPLSYITGDDAADARLAQILEGVGIESALPEAGELCAALSGMYWRVTFDRGIVPDSPIPTFVQPDNAWPEWSWGRLRAVTFFRTLAPRDSGHSVWRHLERHSLTTVLGQPAAVIEHALYCGREGQLGARRPLVDHPEVAELAESLNTEEGIILVGVGRTAGYVPNQRPSRVDRGSPYGRPDIEQQEDLLRGVDDTWTSWLRDVRLGKARILVPDEYLRPVDAPGGGAVFDADREVYSTLRMMTPDKPSDAIKLLQFAIRHAEHEATIRALTQQVVTGAGYTMRAFGMGEGEAVTATQIDSEDELSEVTRKAKVRYWTPGLQELTRALLSMDYALRYPGAVSPPTDGVTIGWPERSGETDQDRAQTVLLLDQARAASTEVKVRLAHPEWTDGEIGEEAARINRETGLPDPAAAGAALGI